MHANAPVYICRSRCIYYRENGFVKVRTILTKEEAAKKLAGVPLRFWHDQILIKDPHNHAPTEFHQDQPYWPHGNSKNPISIWIALVDVSVERGCMTFLPKSFTLDDLPTQSLSDDNSLFSICPELKYHERVTLPLQAGDSTFHHGRCAHMANANDTDEARAAHVAICIDEETILESEPLSTEQPA